MAKLIDIFAHAHPESFIKFVSKLAEMKLIEIPSP
jgi:hypothetical protein